MLVVTLSYNLHIIFHHISRWTMVTNFGFLEQLHPNLVFGPFTIYSRIQHCVHIGSPPINMTIDKRWETTNSNLVGSIILSGQSSPPNHIVNKHYNQNPFYWSKTGITFTILHPKHSVQCVGGDALLHMKMGFFLLGYGTCVRRVVMVLIPNHMNEHSKIISNTF
jgi:hypothetical protein